MREGILIWQGKIDNTDCLVYLVRKDKKASFSVYVYHETEKDYYRMSPVNPKVREVLDLMLDDLAGFTN